jgi:hypothetical protein
VDLQQYIHHPALRASLPIDLLQQAETVYSMNKMDERNDLPHFIGLQMPDKMPMDIGWQLLLLFRQFLYVVLAEIPLTEVVQSPDIRCRPGLGDCHQLYIRSQFAGYPIICIDYYYHVL